MLSFSEPNSVKPDRRSDLIVVLGMHRSGTSVTTRAMEAIGADFGNNLGAPSPCNEKGFFEDLDLVALNCEIMNCLGVDWNALQAPDLMLLDGHRKERLRSQALALLRAKCRNNAIVALKDPRLPRLLSFWLPVFEELGTRVLYAVPFRHPISVARSLEARDHMPPEKAYLLWLAHVVPALRGTEHATRVLVNYDRLIEAPCKELTAISNAFGLTLDPQRLHAFEQDFLDDGLRHTTYSVDDLDQVSAAPSVMKDLFRSMVALADQPTCDDSRQAYEASLTRAEAYLQDIEPIARHEWRMKRELDRVRKHPVRAMFRHLLGRRHALVAQY